MAERVEMETTPRLDDAEYRARLNAEHRRLAGLVAALESEGLDRETEAASVGELAPASQHPADLGSETFERERDMALLEEFRAELDENERASRRLAAGTYGRCDACQRIIDPSRLAAVPATRYCRLCQERYELEGALITDPNTRAPVPPIDITEFLPDDDRDATCGPIGPEDAALHLEAG